MLLLSSFLFMSSLAFSQTNPRIEKALNDPNRRAREAKADVYGQRKAVVADSDLIVRDTAVNRVKKKIK